MGTITANNEENDPKRLLEDIAQADQWMVVTLRAHEKGATLSVRESSGNVLVDTIALLLEQPDIYAAVQAKIADVRLKEEAMKKKSNKSNDTNVN